MYAGNGSETPARIPDAAYPAAAKNASGLLKTAHVAIAFLIGILRAAKNGEDKTPPPIPISADNTPITAPAAGKHLSPANASKIRAARIGRNIEYDVRSKNADNNTFNTAPGTARADNAAANEPPQAPAVIKPTTFQSAIPRRACATAPGADVKKITDNDVATAA